MDATDNKREGALQPADLTGLSLQQAEELSRLGPLQQIYRPDTSSRLLWTGFLLFFALLGLLVAAIPFLPPPENVAPASLPVVVLLVGVIGLVVAGCVWRLRRLTWETRARILLFAHGLARFDGRSLLSCRWEEIESVQGILLKAPKPFACHVIVAIQGGKQLRASWSRAHLAEAQVLVQRVSEESSRHLLPRCLGAVEAGQTVTFQAANAVAIATSGPSGAA